MSIKTILISQPEPTSENSPYSKLIRKYKIKIDYRPFIHVEGLTAKEVRTQKVDFSKFQNIILTSRNAVDHFFRITEDMRFKVPDQTKYFCQSEAVAYYLQKYVVYRKRKIYVGNNNFKDLEPIFTKFNKEKFLVPTSGSLNPDIIRTLDSFEISWDREGETFHKGSLVTVLSNEPGSLADITKIISVNDGNISNIQVVSRSLDYYKFNIDLEVRNLNHLNQIIVAMRLSQFVESVERGKD